MSISMTLRETIVEAGETLETEQTFSGGNELNMDVDIADSVTDQEEEIAIDFSALQVIKIVSDQDLTLETNDGTTPDDTIALSANVPVIWHTGSIHDNILTVDVTSIFLTNASGASANLRIKGLVT